MPKASFAKAQLKKPPGKRRCKACAEPLAGERPPDPPCWICLDNDADPAGHGPPRRDCSCRGTSGYAHISCLIDYASSHAKGMCVAGGTSRIGVSVGGGIVNPWRECPTCRQAYGGNTLYELARAMEQQYCTGAAKGNNNLSPTQWFWKDAALDNLSGVLSHRGDPVGSLDALQKRLELLESEYKRELMSGTKRRDVAVTDRIINVLCNIAGTVTVIKTAPPSVIKQIIDEAERYAREIQPRDKGRGLGAALRQHATLQREIGDHDRAYATMKRAVDLLEKADPNFASGLNGARTLWDLAEMMQAAAPEGGGSSNMMAGYERKKEVVASARRTLGADHGFVRKIAKDVKDFEERLGEEFFQYEKAFRSRGADPYDVLAEEAIAEGFCYTGQRAKVVSMAEGGYRGMLLKDPDEGGGWEPTFIPFTAICFDAQTKVELHDLGGHKEMKRLNGKGGVVVDYEIPDRNFDELRMVVKVDGERECVRVRPTNILPLAAN